MDWKAKNDFLTAPVFLHARFADPKFVYAKRNYLTPENLFVDYGDELQFTCFIQPSIIDLPGVRGFEVIDTIHITATYSIIRENTIKNSVSKSKLITIANHAERMVLTTKILTPALENQLFATAVCNLHLCDYLINYHYKVISEMPILLYAIYIFALRSYHRAVTQNDRPNLDVEIARTASHIVATLLNAKDDYLVAILSYSVGTGLRAELPAVRRLKELVYACKYILEKHARKERHGEVIIDFAKLYYSHLLDPNPRTISRYAVDYNPEKVTLEILNIANSIETALLQFVYEKPKK